MDFLTWYYKFGLKYYLKRWYFNLVWINHYFSLPLLITTMFSPWRRLLVEEKVGFNPTKILEKFTFNLISRSIGAIVRFTLFWVGSIILTLYFIVGAIGFIVWVILPILSIPIYSRQKATTESFSQNLIGKLNNNTKAAANILLNNEAGAFMLKHLGLNFEDLVNNANFKNYDFINKINAKNYEDIIKVFVSNLIWNDDYLRKKALIKEDLFMAAHWWDKRHEDKIQMQDKMYFGRPGIGLELVFGYTPTLNQYSLDLGMPQKFTHHLIGREPIVTHIDRALSAGSNVILIGEPGVGKRTVVYEFARRAISGELGSKMSYRRVLEFDYNFLLSGTSDLSTKKARLAQILSEAQSAGNIILVIKDLQRLTNKEVEGYDFTDTFETYLEKKDLKIIAMSSSAEYERFIATNLRIRKYFNTVEVVAVSKNDAMEILLNAANDWENRKNLNILVPALRKVLDGSEEYITDTPFPEKALELLDQVVSFNDQQKDMLINVDDVDFVLEEKTGISFTRLSENEKSKLSNIEEIIHKNLIDQKNAVSLIAKSIRARSVGVIEGERPIGSFLFLGPTGVGKTLTAKVLADVYYGSDKHILRFDMAEFAGTEGLARLIGSLDKNQPGTLTTAIKNKPASLLLLDEIEKSPKEVFNLFLTLLDEGYIQDSFGKKINCRNLFVIATSNAGAEYIRQLVAKGIEGEELQKDVVDYIQRQDFFSPEFINRFDGVVVFEPLKNEYLVEIAKLMLVELANNLKKKSIYLTVSDDLAKKIAQEGYEPEFGARPMRRIVDLTLGDLLGKSILNGELKEGDRISIITGDGKGNYSWKKI